MYVCHRNGEGIVSMMVIEDISLSYIMHISHTHIYLVGSISSHTLNTHGLRVKHFRLSCTYHTHTLTEIYHAHHTYTHIYTCILTWLVPSAATDLIRID